MESVPPGGSEPSALVESVEEVGRWLRSLGLGEHAEAFARHAIDGPALRLLSDEDLRELGVARIGERRKLSAAMAVFRAPLGNSASSGSREMHSPGPVVDRRWVVVAFIDLSGYTRLSAELDPEDLLEVRRRFSETVAAQVRKHRGVVERYIGDSVMGVFGTRVSDADDVARALLCCLAVKDALYDALAPGGEAIAFHAGVAAGDAVVAWSGDGNEGRQDLTVTGEVVNVASRLTGVAGRGEVLVTAAVARMARDAFDLEPAGASLLKGLARPVEAWRLRGLRDSPGVANTPFVGRALELATMVDALARCRHEGRGRALELVGPPGIGKTRLIAQFRHLSEQRGVTWVSVGSLSFETDGFGVFRAIVAQLGHLAADDQPGEVREPESPESEESSGAALMAAAVAEIMGSPMLPESKARYAALDAVRREALRDEALATAVLTAAVRAPVCIVMEDLHWATDRALRAARLVAGVSQTAPVLLLVTRRGEISEATTAHCSILDVPEAILPLEPIQPHEARLLATAFPGCDADSVDACIHRASGNPLFLEHLLAEAQQSSGLRDLPASLHMLVRTRMDRLGPLDRSWVHAAAVLARPAEAEALEAVSGHANPDCNGAVAEGLFYRDGDILRFTHDLVREAAYAAILKSRRLDLHRQAARWYETRDANARAYHLDRAMDPSAPAAYLSAAQNEAAAYRLSEAFGLCQRGLDCAVDPEDRFELNLHLGGYAHDIGRLTEALGAYQRAYAATENGQRRALALVGLATVKRTTDDLEEALRDLDDAEREAGPNAPPRVLGRVQWLRGSIQFPRGEVRSCVKSHETALRLAHEADDSELEALALSGLGDAEYLTGQMRSARARFTRCVELCKFMGLGRQAAAQLPMVAFTHWLLGEVHKALDVAREAVARARSVEHHRAEMIAHIAAASCCNDLMALDESERHVDRALEIAALLGALRFRGQALALRGERLILMGDRAQALTVFRDAVGLGRQSGLEFLGPTFYACVGLCESDADAAREALAAGETLLSTNGIAHNALLFRRYAIDATLQTGDWSEARRHAEAMHTLGAADPSGWTSFYADRGHLLADVGAGELLGSDTRIDALRSRGLVSGMKASVVRMDRWLAARAET
jgi:class 3 adenylate cyclase/tetratricopeptide (TPR) repeat protein